MTPESFLAANLIVFGGFFIRGFTGFGSILFTLPLLVLWLPVKTVVPLLAILSLSNGAWLTWRAHKGIDPRECGRLLAGGIPGVAAGVLFFHASPDTALRQLLGLLIVGVGLWMIRTPDPARAAWPPAAGFGAGVASGVLGGLFGLAGPAPVLYLHHRPLRSDQFRATLLLVLLVIDLLRGATYAALGSLGGLWLAGIGLFPVSLLGSWCGERLHHRVSEEAFRRALSLLLVLMGVVLMLNSRR